jgi:tetratricopeptide (TPR) repeat protein
MSWRWLSLAGLSVFLGGCYFAQLPDPNEIQGMAQVDAEIMQRNIAMTHQKLDEQIRKGMISPAQKDAEIKRMVEGIVSYVKLDQIPEDEAWRFADLYRQAGDLETARGLLEQAVQVAPSEDRRVNDTMQLARVMAMQGDIKFAVETARKTFDTPPAEKAPILMSALYEIVPAGLNSKSKDDWIVLAQLLEDAIGQHLLVEVDPQTEAGKAFMASVGVHVEKAWDQVFRLYSKAGRDDLLRAAISRRSEQDEKVGKV